MSSQGSISRLITDLKRGGELAADEVWQRYYTRLVSLARTRIRSSRKRVSDEEDIVQEAFNSFFRGVEEVRYPQLRDRQDLWRLLVVITIRKSLDQLRYEQSLRRGGGTVRGNSFIFSLEGCGELDAVSHTPSEEPSPEFAAQVAEECCRLLEALRDDTLQKVALWKMEGYTNSDAARMLGVSLRTIARKVDSIRSIWKQESAV